MDSHTTRGRQPVDSSRRSHRGRGGLPLEGARVDLLLHIPVPVGNDSSTCTRGSAVLAGAAGWDGRRVDSA